MRLLRRQFRYLRANLIARGVPVGVFLPALLAASLWIPGAVHGDELGDIRSSAAAGRAREAIAMLKKSARSAEQEYQLLLARLYLDTNQLRNAAQLYEVLCPAARSANCWNRLGVVRMSMGGYKQAVLQFKKALKLDDGSARTYSNLGLAYFYMRRMVEAGEAHEKARALEPDNIGVSLNYAIFLFSSRRFYRARAILKGLLRKKPDLFFAHLYLGRIEFKERRYRRAVMHFSEGIRANPRFFELYYHRAHARYRLRDYGGAMSDVRKADKIDPLNGQTGPLKRAIRRRRR